MEQFFNIISNFGFPIAVASYLLFRFEKKLEILEQTNQGLIVEVKTLQKINGDLLEDIKSVQKKITQMEKIITGLKRKI